MATSAMWLSTVGYTGSASTLTCTLDVVNGSVSLIGGLPHCSVTLCVVDCIPNGAATIVTESISGISLCQLFRQLRARRRHIFHPVLWIKWLSCQRHLSCPRSALFDDNTVEGLDRSSLTLGEACVVSCADGYTAAGDTEITMTCVFDPELTSMLLEGCTHTCKLAPYNPQHTHASFHSESRLPEHSP